MHADEVKESLRWIDRSSGGNHVVAGISKYYLSVDISTSETPCPFRVQEYLSDVQGSGVFVPHVE